MSISRTLTFGDDGSPSADLAWLFVNSQTWPGWRCEVITAEMPRGLQSALPPERSELHTWDRPDPRKRFAEAEFSQVVELKAEADPRLVLSKKSDLLVIGPRGAGLLKSLHLGSTAEWLLLHPPSPVLIAHRGQPVQTAVVCADGSPHADKVAGVLAGLPWAAGLAVTLLVVDDDRIDVGSAAARPRQLLEAAGAAVQVMVTRDTPKRAISDHLETTNPDLVALGTRGLTGMKRLRLGSTAGAIARSATCSVLLACDEDD